MKKKIIIICSLSLVLLLVIGYVVSFKSKDEYIDKINLLDGQIAEISAQIDEQTSKKAQLEEEYNQLNLIYTNSSKDPLINWFNLCNNYISRSNVLIENKSYNDFLGVETSKKIINSCGVIISINNSDVYILTTYDSIIKASGFSKQQLHVCDAFNKSYDAQIVKEDNDANLALLKITKSSNDLYAASISKINSSVGDFVCTIYSSDEKGLNHMYFTKKINDNLITFDYSTFQKGMLCVNLKGELIGIINSIENSKDNITATLIDCNKITEFINE